MKNKVSKQTEYKFAYRAKRRAEGLCPIAGCKRQPEGWACRFHKAAQNAQHATIRAKRIAKHLCVRCRRRNRTRSSECKVCATVTSTKARISRLERISRGLCSICPRVLQRGRTMCSVHLVQMRRRAQERKQEGR